MRQDRRGSPDDPPVVPAPFLAIVGNLPPDTLADFRRERGHQDGFIERILFYHPAPRPKSPWSDLGVPEEIAAKWRSLVLKLHDRPMQGHESGPAVITFEDEAKAAWVGWYDSHVELMNSESPDAGDPASEWKLCDFAGRMALILHLVRVAADPATKPNEPTPPVSLAAVGGAIRLWAYFRSHQRRVQSAMAGRGIAGAPRLAKLIHRWIGNHAQTSTFTQASLSRCYAPSRGYDPDEMEEGLNWLAERNCIRPLKATIRPRGQKGPYSSQAWEVHPELIASLSNQKTRNGPPTHTEEGLADNPDSPDIPEQSPAASDPGEVPDGLAA